MHTHLPRVRGNTAALGTASYKAPCAIGAMMTVEERRAVHDLELNNSAVATLVKRQAITIPDNELPDFQRLQRAFDSGHEPLFTRVLDELERKYA